MPALLYPPSVNALQKTLDANLDQGVTSSMTLNNTTNVQNKPGLVVVNRIDTDGNEKAASAREYIQFTAVSGSTLTGLTRAKGGSTDQDHSVGAVVEFINDVTQQQAILDVITAEHGTDGTHDNTKVVMMTGNQTIAGVKTFSSFPVTPSSDPTTDYQVATKKYVDDNAGAGGKYEIPIPGAAVAGTGQGTWHAPTGITSVDTVQIVADTAGATGSTVADINKNGTSIFPSATKPTLADTATSNTATPDTTAATGGDIYTVDLDSVTTTPQTTIRIVFYYS